MSKGFSTVLVDSLQKLDNPGVQVWTSLHLGSVDWAQEILLVYKTAKVL